MGIWIPTPISGRSTHFNQVQFRRTPNMKLLLVLIATLVALTNAKVFFEEQFKDDSYTDRWVQSTHKDDLGKFELSAGSFYGDAEKDKGIKTSQDAKFYGLSAKFDKFSNEGKNLVIQFTVKHGQNIDCGGGYAKIFPCDFDGKSMHGETPYNIMFGPDICGPGTKKVHVIFNYKDKNHLVKKDIRCKDDVYTHLYTLIVKPDNTYEVLIDNEKAESGSLEEDWDMLPAKKIKDPEAKKPEDWVDNAKMDDPEDSKPEDWDKPEHIADPDATKPDDWDDEYKGEWKPKQIDNPDYKGAWVHPEIDNPEYEEDKSLYSYDSFCGIGFDLWQVKSGTIFDNVLITDDIEAAKAQGEELWKATSEAENSEPEDDEDDEEFDDEDEDDKEDADEAHDELEVNAKNVWALMKQMTQSTVNTSKLKLIRFITD